MSPAPRGKAGSVSDDAQLPCAQGCPPSPAPQLPQGKGGSPVPSPRAAPAPAGSLPGPTHGHGHPEHFGAGGATRGSCSSRRSLPSKDPHFPACPHSFKSVPSTQAPVTPRSPSEPSSPTLRSSPPALSFGSQLSSSLHSPHSLPYSPGPSSPPPCPFSRGSPLSPRSL